MQEPKVLYCQITYADMFEGTYECVRRVAPYVDGCIIVVEEQRPFTDEQKQKLMDFGNVHLIERPFLESIPDFRNSYLEEAKRLKRENNWDSVYVCVSDTDEFYCEELCKDLKKIVKEADSKGINILGINSRDQFEAIEWLDDLDKLKEVPGGYKESNFWKQLIFKLCCDELSYRGIGSVKRVHEFWGCPNHPWKPANLPKKYYYRHVKSALDIYRNAARNLFLSGGGDNCLTSDTLIITHAGLKKIENVDVGDKVLNKDGKFVDVFNKIPKYYSGKILKVKPSRGIEVGVTPDHRMLVCNRVSTKRREKSKRFHNIGRLSTRYELQNTWIRASNIVKVKLGHTGNNEGQLSYFPIPVDSNDIPNRTILEYKRRDFKNINVDLNNPKLWYLIGVYLADGNLTDDKNSIEMSITSNQVDNIQSIVRDIFGKTCKLHPDNRTNKYIRLRLHLSPFAKWLFDNFQEGSFSKYIHPKWLDVPTECLEELVNALFDCDGTTFTSNQNSTIAKKIDLVNPSISAFIYLALLKLGKFPSIYCYEEKIG